MALLLEQKRRILKKKLRELNEFTFPELREADNILRKTPRNLKGNIESYPGAELDAFSPDRLKDPRFRKQLRKLQEKHNITDIA